MFVFSILYLLNNGLLRPTSLGCTTTYNDEPLETFWKDNRHLEQIITINDQVSIFMSNFYAGSFGISNTNRAHINKNNNNNKNIFIKLAISRCYGLRSRLIVIPFRKWFPFSLESDSRTPHISDLISTFLA